MAKMCTFPHKNVSGASFVSFLYGILLIEMCSSPMQTYLNKVFSAKKSYYYDILNQSKFHKWPLTNHYCNKVESDGAILLHNEILQKRFTELTGKLAQ